MKADDTVDGSSRVFFDESSNTHDVEQGNDCFRMLQDLIEDRSQNAHSLEGKTLKLYDINGRLRMSRALIHGFENQNLQAQLGGIYFAEIHDKIKGSRCVIKMLID